jgi:hypothetical protein
MLLLLLFNLSFSLEASSDWAEEDTVVNRVSFFGSGIYNFFKNISISLFPFHEIHHQRPSVHLCKE